MKKISLNTRKITWCLISVASILVLVHILILITFYIINDPGRFDFIEMFDLDYEGNIPTLFSSFLLLLSAMLLWLCGYGEQVYANEKNNKPYWCALSIIFVFLSIDEGTRLHEEIGDVIENYVDAEGFLYFPWVIPYSIGVALIGIVYIPFLRSIPEKTKTRIILSAIIYLAGAVGMDILSAREADINDTTTITYSLMYTIEEILEFAGIILFINTLLQYLGKDKDIELKFA